MTLRSVLQPFVAPGRARRAGRSCELCGAPVGAEHSHVADVEARAFLCACRGCGLLFTRAGSAGGRLRTVPDRHVYEASFALTDAEWEALGIPVSMAFFFKSSVAERWSAVYPSPAGPVESLLRLDAWSSIASRTSLANLAEPDVEALLVAANGGVGYECMLVPIHACYALVGHVRRRWRGLDGGEEAHRAIADHFGTLRARCEPLSGVQP